MRVASNRLEQQLPQGIISLHGEVSTAATLFHSYSGSIMPVHDSEHPQAVVWSLECLHVTARDRKGCSPVLPFEQVLMSNNLHISQRTGRIRSRGQQASTIRSQQLSTYRTQEGILNVVRRALFVRWLPHSPSPISLRRCCECYWILFLRTPLYSVE